MRVILLAFVVPALAPGVPAAGHHAGSRATADRRVMAAVLGVVKARGLWFEENRVTAASVASAVAGGLHLPVLLVTTYLDDPSAGIDARVRRLIATAQRQGRAVAAAHLTTGAPPVVRRLLPKFRRAGIVFVPPTEFLAVPEGR